MDIIEQNVPLTANEIMAKLYIKSKNTLKNKYIHPAIKSGLIKQTSPDKPNSKNQKYYKE